MWSTLSGPCGAATMCGSAAPRGGHGRVRGCNPSQPWWRLPAPPTRGLPEVPQPVEEPGRRGRSSLWSTSRQQRGLSMTGLAGGAFRRRLPVRRTRARPRFTQRSEQKAALEQGWLGFGWHVLDRACGMSVGGLCSVMCTAFSCVMYSTK